MSNFIHRVASWLANEVAGKLSQSQGFQRMAGKAVRNIDNAQKLAKNQSEKIAKRKRELSKMLVNGSGFKEKGRFSTLKK